MGIGYSALTMAVVTGVPNEEQGLAASIQSTSLQVGGGLGLALIVAVANAVTLSSTQNSSDSTTAAQLQGFHIGPYLISALAVVGALIALVGLRERPAKRACGSSGEKKHQPGGSRRGIQSPDGRESSLTDSSAAEPAPPLSTFPCFWSLPATR
jgi:sugar phosphate permease